MLHPLKRGIEDDKIVFRPPYVITKNDIDDMIAILDEAIAETI